jgi:hypothetical protein
MPDGNVSVKAMPVKARLGFELVMVNVSVDVLPATAGFGENDFAMEGGAMAFTVFEPVLFDSLTSVMLLLGSTVAVLARLLAATGVTVKLTTMLPVVPIVTEAPLALQVSVPVVMPQLILAAFVILTNDPAVGVP